MPRVSAAMVAAGRTVAEPRLGPGGETLAFVAVEDGASRLVLVDTDGGAERVVTTDPSPRASRTFGGGAFAWHPEGQGFVVAGRRGGLWWQPVGGGPASGIVEGDGISSPAVSPDGTRVAFTVEDRHVDVTTIDGRDRVRLSGDADFVMDPAWSPDGSALAWQEWDVPFMAWDESRIVIAASGGGVPRTIAGGAGAQAQQPRFSPDGSHLAFLTDVGGWLNLTVLDLGSGATVALTEEKEHGAPTWGPGQRSHAWSPGGDALAVCRNERGFGALVIWTPGGAARQVARAVHGGLDWRGPHLVAERSGGRTPTQIVVHSGADLADRRTLAHGPVLMTRAPMPEPDVVSWAASDGAEIPGRLYRPDGGGDGRLLVWVHGGPTDQWQVTFRARFAYWLDRGWAILVPDHRGSTGHGRAFTQSLAGRWGELDVEDTAAGIRAAIERGWATAGRVVITGGSAGGFTVLNLLASHPGLCAAGVDLYGVTDLLALAEVDHRYEAHYLHSLVGPLPAFADAHRARSPRHRVAGIVDPVLILQGADDPVVPLEQSEAIARELAARGRVVELHVYAGEGHGWSRAETIIDELTRTESFLQRHVP